MNFIQGNAHKYRVLERIVKSGWDVIVDFMVYNTPEFQQRHSLILDATKQYFFISSLVFTQKLTAR